MSPAFQFYPQDFLASPRVQAMTVEEVGAYCLLLFSAWVNSPQGYLPDDDELLRKICRMSSEQWRRSRSILRSFFSEGSGTIFHHRLLIELKKQKNYSETQRRNALKRKDKGATAQPRLSQRPAKGSPSSSSSSSSSSSDDEYIGLFLSAWNALPAPFPRVKKLGTRRKSLKTRMADPYWRENWRGALALMAGRPFCRGENDRGWVADLDFFLRPDTVTCLLEGKYASKARGVSIND